MKIILILILLVGGLWAEEAAEKKIRESVGTLFNELREKRISDDKLAEMMSDLIIRYHRELVKAKDEKAKDQMKRITDSLQGNREGVERVKNSFEDMSREQISLFEGRTYDVLVMAMIAKSAIDLAQCKTGAEMSEAEKAACEEITRRAANHLTIFEASLRDQWERLGEKDQLKVRGFALRNLEETKIIGDDVAKGIDVVGLSEADEKNKRPGLRARAKRRVSELEAKR